MESMTRLQLSTKLWIADLHDIDQSSRGSELVTVNTNNQCLHLKQDVVFANSYRRRSPMVTIALAEDGYTPKLDDLSCILNSRACYHTHYTILAGSYWENTISNKDVITFYNKFLKNDSAVVSHRKFYGGTEEENNNELKSKSSFCSIAEVENDSKWNWRQKYSNFPFLLFTTCKPDLTLISLGNRTELDCVVVWDVVQKSHTIGKAYFLPYGIPDMVGEAGIGIFLDRNKCLKGLFMSEKLRDSFRKENNDVYRRAQELCVSAQLVGNLDDTCTTDMTDEGSMEDGILDYFACHGGLPDPTSLAAILGFYGCSDASEDDINLIDSDYDVNLCDSDNLYDSDFDMNLGDTDDEDSDIIYDTDNDSEDCSIEFPNCDVSENGDIYGPNEYEPPLVMFSRTGNIKAVQKFFKASGFSPVQINVARKWTEVEEKMGYDKSWDWYDDTPLIAASREGHFDVVKYLVSHEADPTLESCHRCDVYETALKAANDTLLKRKSRIEDLLKGSASSYERKKNDPKEDALDILDEITNLENIVRLLELVEPYWKKCSYSSSHYSNERQKRMAMKPNFPTDSKQMKEKISSFMTSATELVQLDKLTQAVKKFKFKAQPTKSTSTVKQEVQAKPVEKPSASVDTKPVKKQSVSINTKPVKKQSVNVDTKPVKKQSVNAETKADSNKSSSGNNTTKLLRRLQSKIISEGYAENDKSSKSKANNEVMCGSCVKKAAKDCKYGKCGSCCRGPCKRHLIR